MEQTLNVNISEPIPVSPDEANSLPVSPPVYLASLDLNTSQCSIDSLPWQSADNLKW